jgi:hypothetical protein
MFKPICYDPAVGRRYRNGPRHIDSRSWFERGKTLIGSSLSDVMNGVTPQGWTRM